MNKAILLKEMGISSYKLKNNIPKSPKIEQQEPENISMTAEFPVWTLVYEEHDVPASLWKNLHVVIRNFGVEIQLLAFRENDLTPQDIQGQLVICFGQKAGQRFSGEKNPIEELREILFETSNCHGQEIPVIVSYSVGQIAHSAERKKQLWDDLILARNVYLDTMS